ncbi:hypothetical protein [Marinagarivorans algicola]|uniref:hypothetical protein n=1 Tax=Marinagarivorans algicola TaxID=1513270 RepID=UPI0006B4F6F3|nr:hypothetical protein [Marinagarivorans algicola]
MTDKGKLRRMRNVSTAVALLVVMIVVAVASWFYMRQMSSSAQQDKAYRNVTLTDALLKCREFSEQRYGTKLKSLTFDSHSSRWDQQSGQYKVFFTAVMSSGKRGAISSDYWVSCDVSGRNGSVRDYDMLEDQSLKTEAQRADSGGMFGWP